MPNVVEIEYLEPKREFHIGSVKNIAVPSNNKDDIKKMFPGVKTVQSNADMLNESFSTSPEITPIPNNNSVQEVPITPNVVEPVQISGIPTTGLSNLESIPANLNMSTPVMNAVPEMSSIEPIVNNIQEIPQNNDSVNNAPLQVENNNVLVSNIDVPNEQMSVSHESNIPAVGMESSFKVSDAPNIFDNPIPSPVNITEEEINKPLDIKSPMEQPLEEENNIFSKSIPVNSSSENDLNDDMILAEIAILENDIKHYEGLAENNRKKIELLKKQIKKDNDVNLENTASNLFNNNGVLDEDKVLGKTPIPNLRVA